MRLYLVLKITPFSPYKKHNQYVILLVDNPKKTESEKFDQFAMCGAWKCNLIHGEFLIIQLLRMHVHSSIVEAYTIFYKDKFRHVWCENIS